MMYVKSINYDLPLSGSGYCLLGESCSVFTNGCPGAEMKQSGINLFATCIVADVFFNIMSRNPL